MSGFEFFCIIMNYATVVPVILAVGAFRFALICHKNFKLIARMQHISLH